MCGHMYTYTYTHNHCTQVHKQRWVIYITVLSRSRSHHSLLLPCHCQIHIIFLQNLCMSWGYLLILIPTIFYIHRDGHHQVLLPVSSQPPLLSKLTNPQGTLMCIMASSSMLVTTHLSTFTCPVLSFKDITFSIHRRHFSSIPLLPSPAWQPFGLFSWNGLGTD